MLRDRPARRWWLPRPLWRFRAPHPSSCLKDWTSTCSTVAGNIRWAANPRQAENSFPGSLRPASVVHTANGSLFENVAGSARKLALFGREDVLQRDQAHDRERNGEKSPDRPPQPGPERQRQQDRQGVE